MRSEHSKRLAILISASSVLPVFTYNVNTDTTSNHPVHSSEHWIGAWGDQGNTATVAVENAESNGGAIVVYGGDLFIDRPTYSKRSVIVKDGTRLIIRKGQTLCIGSTCGGANAVMHPAEALSQADPELETNVPSKNPHERVGPIDTRTPAPPAASHPDSKMPTTAHFEAQASVEARTPASRIPSSMPNQAVHRRTSKAMAATLAGWINHGEEEVQDFVQGQGSATRWKGEWWYDLAQIGHWSTANAAPDVMEVPVEAEMATLQIHPDQIPPSSGLTSGLSPALALPPTTHFRTPTKAPGAPPPTPPRPCPVAKLPATDEVRGGSKIGQSSETLLPNLTEASTISPKSPWQKTAPSEFRAEVTHVEAKPISSGNDAAPETPQARTGIFLLKLPAFDYRQHHHFFHFDEKPSDQDLVKLSNLVLLLGLLIVPLALTMCALGLMFYMKRRCVAHEAEEGAEAMLEASVEKGSKSSAGV